MLGHITRWIYRNQAQFQAWGYQLNHPEITVIYSQVGYEIIDSPYLNRGQVLIAHIPVRHNKTREINVIAQVFGQQQQ